MTEKQPHQGKQKTMNIIALFTTLAVLAAPAPCGSVQGALDIPGLFAEIAGDYEFYANQRYFVLTIYVDQGKVWGREEGNPGPQELRPVEPSGLKFKVDDPGKEQYAVFVRGGDGKIAALRMVTGDRELIAPRIPAGGRPPQAPDQPFSAEDLRSDLAQIRRALEENHPAVNAFTGKEDLERLYKRQLGQIDGPKTLGEFYGIAAPLVAAVGCGHTSLTSPKDYWKSAPPRFFPLGLRFVGGRAYVIRGADPAGMPQRGSEIRAVNGRGAAAILQEFKGLVSSDGANDGWKTALINSAFARYYALRFGFPGEFVVEARPTGQKTVREVRLQPVDLSKVPGEPSGTKPLTSSGDPNLDLKILPGETSAAVLTIGSFSYYQEVDKFKGFIDESFDRIRKAGVRHLILDLRDNDGGDPFCTTHLLSYLEPRPVPYFARVYPSPYEPFAEPIPRAAGAFEGKLVVLVNAGCFSSTGHFCALLRFHKIGTFIGTETGGTYECNDARREIHLERTRLRLFVARMAFAAAVQSLPRYRGIVPDIVVEPSIADELAGKDPVLERALAIIAGGGGFE
jgi:hypothetical protein